jgi:3',5'-cyclic AMP phosphodiesterase CpdA
MTVAPGRLAFAVAWMACALAACGGGSTEVPAGPSPGPIGRAEADVLVVGDIGLCGSSGTVATAQLVERLPGRVLLAGDIAYPNGSPEDFEQCFHPLWGRFSPRWHAVPGNHEYLQPNASGYFGYFDAAAGQDRSGYYALTLGEWQVLMLDSNLPTQRGSAQWEFVRRELDLANRPCTLAVWHHPLFSSGQNGPNAYMRDLYALLEAGGADAVVNAHDHLYERFARQTAEGRPSEQGVRQFIAGTGGAELYRFVTTAPNSEARIAQHGVLHLALQPAGYRWEFVLAAGGLGDSGSEACR